MKRATLTAYSSAPPSAPADLTDRLLEQKDGLAAPAAAKPRRTRARLAASTPGPEPPAAPEANAAGLKAALAAADNATEALRQAARAAPARYDVALRYRLDALAHHVDQVKSFVESLAGR